MISAGELREKIDFKRPVRTQNNSGGFDTVDNLFLSTYASVVEETSKPVLVANQENIVNYVHFKIRYRPNLFIKIGDKLEWRGFLYSVNNIKVSKLRTQIDIFVNSDMETSER